MDHYDDEPMEPTPRKELDMQGDEDTASANIEEEAGEMTSAPSMERQGEARQMEGGMQTGPGRRERHVDDVFDDEHDI